MTNTYSCKTSVIEYKYQYSYDHQALSLLYYKRNGRRFFFKSNRIIQLVLCKQLALYGIKLLNQLLFVIICSHNHGIRSGIP